MGCTHASRISPHFENACHLAESTDNKQHEFDPNSNAALRPLVRQNRRSGCPPTEKSLSHIQAAATSTTICAGTGTLEGMLDESFMASPAPSSHCTSGSLNALVVLVDECAADRAVHARLLMASGCSSLCCNNIPALLNDLFDFTTRGGNPENYADFILVDIASLAMGGNGATGSDTMWMIRQRGYEGHIVILIGHATDEPACLAAGASAVLLKPVTSVALRTAIATLPSYHRTQLQSFPKPLRAQTGICAHPLFAEPSGTVDATACAVLISSSLADVVENGLPMAQPEQHANHHDVAADSSVSEMADKIAAAGCTALQDSEAALATMTAQLVISSDALAAALSARAADATAATSLAKVVAASADATLAESELARYTELAASTDLARIVAAQSAAVLNAAITMAQDARVSDAAAATSLAVNVAMLSATLADCMVARGTEAAAATVLAAHVALQSAAELTKLTAATSVAETRRQFMRYIFHEVRVPFNTIILGLGEMRNAAVARHDAGALGDLMLMQAAAHSMLR